MGVRIGVGFTGATDVSSTWTNLTNAYDADDTTSATTTNVTTTHILDLTGAATELASVIPSGSTINGVTIYVRQAVGAAVRWANPLVRLYDGTTALGSADITLTEYTTPIWQSSTAVTGLSYSDITSTNFKLRVSMQRTSATGSTLGDFYGAYLVVEYTPASGTLLYLTNSYTSTTTVRPEFGPQDSSTTLVGNYISPRPNDAASTLISSLLAQTRASVTGPVTDPGIGAFEASGYRTLVTQPFSASTTISGEVRLAATAYTSDVAANAAIRAVLWRVSPDGSASVVFTTPASAELTTFVALSDVKRYWAVTPTSTTCAVGDVLMLTFYFTDAPSQTMASGATLTYRGYFSTANELAIDAFIHFTESLPLSATPTGTVTNVLATASDVSGSGKKKLWTDTVSGTATTYTVNTADEPTANQWTDSAGGTALDWYTPPLEAVTLAGPLLTDCYGQESNALANHTPLMRVYKTEEDGSSPVQIGWVRGVSEQAAGLDGYLTFLGAVNGSLTAGQRLLVRFFTSSASGLGTSQTSGYTASLVVENTSYPMRITWPGTLVESTTTPKSDSDTGSGTDAATTRALADTDTGAGADSGTLDVGTTEKSSTETAVGTDTVTARTQTSADTGTGVDASSAPDTSEAKSSTETATSTDAVTVRAQTSTDTATSTDVVTVRAQTSTDTGTSTDAVTVSALALSSADTSTGAEAVTVRGISGAADTATGAEASNLDNGAITNVFRWTGAAEVAATSIGVWNGSTTLPATEVRPLPPGYSSQAAMLAEDTFYVAHRGGSANWPEGSLHAYTNAVNWGSAGALEVPLARTSDGVWFSLHDQTLLRTSGVDINPNTLTWSQVQAYNITASGTTDTGQAVRPYMRAEELFALYGNTHVLFIDPKYQNTAGLRAELLDLVQDYVPTTRIVGKYYYTNTVWATDCAARGIPSWGYLYTADVPNLDTYAGSWTYLGLEYSATQGNWDTVLAKGKPVIGHIASLQAHIDTAISRGASGVMVSGILSMSRREMPYA